MYKRAHRNPKYHVPIPQEIREVYYYYPRSISTQLMMAHKQRAIETQEGKFWDPDYYYVRSISVATCDDNMPFGIRGQAIGDSWVVNG